MKRITALFLTTIFLLSGCASAKKNLSKGNYDAAIDRAVRELRKNPKSEKDILSLEQAMKIVLEQDNERIRYLKTEGRADSWDEVYLIYQKMYNRQLAVRTVTPLTVDGRTVDFPYVDYLVEMTNAKKKAADFYFAHGNQLLGEGTKESYRQAYAEFQRVKEYVGDYNNINNLLVDTRYKGISRALVRVSNSSLLNLPEGYSDELLNINISSFNSDWVEYYTTVLDQNMTIDYLIEVNINGIGVSPDQQFQLDTMIKKDIPDGFNYVLDAKGNVKKDSLGNDMKVPKYKTLQCALIQTIQKKECTIQGKVDFIDLSPEQILRSEPLTAVSSFEHVSARAIGEVEALNAQQKEMIKSSPAVFPTDFEMILMCSDALKGAIRDAIGRNRNIIW